nr:MAG TPA: hypothetical protein [Caudoviricetes sp.]
MPTTNQTNLFIIPKDFSFCKYITTDRGFFQVRKIWKELFYYVKI